MPNTTQNTLSQAILQTITYSDIFDYPLTAPEIHRYLIGVKASLTEVSLTLPSMTALIPMGEYYCLPDRQEIVNIRRQREARSKKLLPSALWLGRVLGSLPFVRMVTLTGSLAVMNISKHADFDYMLVTVPGRVWTARLFAVGFNRLTRLLGYTLCPNLIVAETTLAWPLHDLYSARELFQMIPITGMDVYRRLIKANEWAYEFLPNAFQESDSRLLESQKRISVLQPMVESLLHGKFGDRFERWEMSRKIARFSKQAGFGEETIFTAEVCQGNFHHHRKWTREAFEEKLQQDAVASGARPSEVPPSSKLEIASSHDGISL